MKFSKLGLTAAALLLSIVAYAAVRYVTITDTTFSVTNIMGAQYYITTHANLSTAQWKPGDVVVFDQNGTIAAYVYNANGNWSATDPSAYLPSTSTGGGTSGGTGSYGGGSNYLIISGVPVFVNGQCVANCGSGGRVIITRIV